MSRMAWLKEELALETELPPNTVIDARYTFNVDDDCILSIIGLLSQGCHTFDLGIQTEAHMEFIFRSTEVQKNHMWYACFADFQGHLGSRVYLNECEVMVLPDLAITNTCSIRVRVCNTYVRTLGFLDDLKSYNTKKVDDQYTEKDSY